MVAQLQGREAAGRAKAPRRGGSGYRGRQGVDAARVEEIKKLYGFDKPAHERFLQMLGQFARFDLGKSFFQNKDVWQLIKEKLPVSISLGLWTFLLVYLISRAARHRQGGARRHALRHGDDLRRAARLCDPELRPGRGAARALRRRLVRAVVPAARAHLDQLGRI